MLHSTNIPVLESTSILRHIYTDITFNDQPRRTGALMPAPGDKGCQPICVFRIQKKKMRFRVNISA